MSMISALTVRLARARGALIDARPHRGVSAAFGTPAWCEAHLADATSDERRSIDEVALLAAVRGGGPPRTLYVLRLACAARGLPGRATRGSAATRAASCESRRWREADRRCSRRR